jgi:hypothetical protein
MNLADELNNRNELDDVVARLKSANYWRRHGGGDQPDPKQLGLDIDYAVRMLVELRDKLEAGR